MTDRVLLETVHGVDLMFSPSDRRFVAKTPSGAMIRRTTFSGLKKRVCQVMGVKGNNPTQPSKLKGTVCVVWSYNGPENHEMCILTGRSELRKIRFGGQYRYYEVVKGPKNQKGWYRAHELRVASAEAVARANSLTRKWVLAQDAADQIHDELNAFKKKEFKPLEQLV